MSAAALAVAPSRSKSPAGEPFKRRRAGYTPLDHRQVFYELSRLTAGKTQLLCILYVLQSTAGASRAAGENAPSESEPISTEEFAWFCGEKNLRTIQMALEDLCERKVLLRKAKKRGEYVYSAPVASWEKLPSFLPPKKPVDSAESLDESGSSTEDEGEEEANLRRRKLRLNSLGEKPLALAAGRPSKALALEADVDGTKKPIPIAKVQFDCNAQTEIDLLMHRGILRGSIKTPEPWHELKGAERAAAFRLMQELMDKNIVPATDFFRTTYVYSASIRAKTGRSLNEENFVERNGHAASKELADAMAARGAPMEAAISGRELSRLMSVKRDALNRWFRDKLGPVEDAIVRKCITAQATATDPDVFAVLRRRASAIKGWGLVVDIHGDVGRAAAKAGHAKTDISRPANGKTNGSSMSGSIETLRQALRFAAEDPSDQAAIAVIEAADAEQLAEARAGL